MIGSEKELKNRLEQFIGNEHLKIRNTSYFGSTGLVNGAFFGNNYNDVVTDKTYTRMMNDPIINSSIELLIGMVLNSTYKLINPATPLLNDKNGYTKKDYELGEEIKKYCEKMITGLNSSTFNTVLKELLYAIVYGCTVAEKKIELIDGKYIITDIKIKPPYTYSFILDDFNNCLGVINNTDVFRSVEEDASKIIPKDLLIVYSHNPRFNDPYGNSLLRPIYKTWLFKQSIEENYNKYMYSFATPSIIGMLPESASLSEDGTSLINDWQTGLAQYSGGSNLVHEYGGKIYTISNTSGSDIYKSALNYVDNQIASCILKSARATSEAEHGSKADSETSYDIVKNVVSGIQKNLEEIIYDSIFYQITVLNWGKAVADKLAPRIQFTDSDRTTMIKFGYIIKELFLIGFLSPSQIIKLDELMNLPGRSLEDLEFLVKTMRGEINSDDSSNVVEAKKVQEKRKQVKSTDGVTNNT